MDCRQAIDLNYIILNKLNRITSDKQLISGLKIYFRAKTQRTLREIRDDRKYKKTGKKLYELSVRLGASSSFA